MVLAGGGVGVHCPFPKTLTQFKTKAFVDGLVDTFVVVKKN